MTCIERQQEWIKLLEKRLDEKRFIHSLGVAKSAGELAALYGADEEKATIAGLIHDITKNESEKEQLQMIENGGIILTQSEKANASVWHAISGSVYAREVLHIEDEEILGAIRWHTTGKAGMTLLEKIVYIADYISAERDYPDVEVMRTLARESLEKAALYSLKYTLNKLSSGERLIDENGVAFYNELIMQKITLTGSDRNDGA